MKNTFLLICLIIGSFLFGTFLGNKLFACEREDFPHFHSRMYEESVIHNLKIAEGYFRDYNYREAHVFFEIAFQEYQLVTFSDPKLKFRIDIGLLFSEILEHPEFFADKNVYINRLLLIMQGISK